MRPTLPVRRAQLGVCAVSFLAAGFAWAQVYSHARIVRLSFVEGTVTVQRPDVPEWGSAPVNTPIQEGFKLATAGDSFAEVEFENTSTARLGQLSLLEFTQLALSPTGGKINRLALDQGYATFHIITGADDIFEVSAAGATLRPSGKSTFRIDLDGGVLRVEAFKGSVEVASPFGSETLAKNMLLVMRPGAQPPVEISHGITKDDWDEWVERRENIDAKLDRKRVHGLYSADVNDLLYGWGDLWNYGMWTNIPAYGHGWIPNVPVGWSPYTYGRWCWYPGFGYTWISAEPWGWLPYHYGQWNYVAGFGWCWIPGNFSTWSPAQVTWYQGPGWIGWTPATGGAGALVGQPGCPNPQGCALAVSSGTFQSGKPVTPANLLRVDPSQGVAVANPDLSPTRQIMLPGPPLRQVDAGSPVVFDSVNRRFVNAHSGSDTSTDNISLPAGAAVNTGIQAVAPVGSSTQLNRSGPTQRNEGSSASTGMPFHHRFDGRGVVEAPGEAPSPGPANTTIRSTDLFRGAAPSTGIPASARQSYFGVGGVEHPGVNPGPHFGGSPTVYSAPASVPGSFGGGAAVGPSPAGTAGGSVGGGGARGGGHSDGGHSSAGPRR